jgi:hypothetical protein
MSLTITNWSGRLGNNLLQIIRAIHYGLLHNIPQVIFNTHYALNKNMIHLDISNYNS